MANVTNVVSHKVQSAESSDAGQIARARGAKKSALGVFSKLLAGLIRKNKGGAEAATAGEGSGAKEAGAVKAARESREGLAKLRGLSKNELNKKDSLLELSNGKAKKNNEALALAGKEKDKKAALLKGGEENLIEKGLAAAAAEGVSRVQGDEAVPKETIGADLARLNGGGGEPEAEAAAGAGRKSRGREAAAETAPETGEGAKTTLEAFRFAQAANKQAAAGTEKKESGKSAVETKNAKKNRERFSLEVQDLRTADAAAVPGQEPKHTGESGPVRETEIAVELRPDRARSEAGDLGQQKTASQAFEDILGRELHQNLNGDIVRHASVLVRDGGEGTIKLSLKPESLGIVKVRLEMAENKITGHIIVESKEALRAFEQDMHSLEQAFRDSGFDGATLDMSLASGGGNGANQDWNSADTNFLAPFPLVSASYDAAAEIAGDDGEGISGIIRNGLGMPQVNMLV